MDWKDKLSNLVTENPELNAEPTNKIILPSEPAPKKPKQTLRVELDKRKGKLATLITEYDASDDEIKTLAKTLKVKLGVGGSTRDGEILVQGDVRHKVAELLIQLGFKVRRINF